MEKDNHQKERKKKEYVINIGKVSLRVRGFESNALRTLYEGFLSDARHSNALLDVIEVAKKGMRTSSGVTQEIRDFPLYCKSNFFPRCSFQRPRLRTHDLQLLFSDPLFKENFSLHTRNSSCSYMLAIARSVLFFDPTAGKAYLFLFHNDKRSTKESEMILALYFLLPKLFAYRGGFILHSAGIISNKKAYLFIGKSGIGKTTVAKKSGSRRILSDDAIGIYRHNGRFNAVATPWGTYKRDTQSSGLNAPVDSVFFLNKAKMVAFRKLNVHGALKRSLPQILNSYTTDQELRNTFELLNRFFNRHSAWDMYFTKTKDFWPYLPQNGG